MSKWFIEKGILKYETDDNQIIIPNAETILKISYSQTDIISENPQIKAHSPSEDIPRIRISSRPPRISGRTYFSSDFEVILEFGVNLREEYVTLSKDRLEKSDHIVNNNIWYSLREAKTIIFGILEDSGIKDLGVITVREYMNLLKAIRNYSHRITWTDDANPEKMVNDLDRNFISTPSSFTGNLYPYQKDGYFWLKHFSDGECGCILADEMGLGKTIQIIALIVSRREKASTPALVVCPVSLMENWRREIAKFSTNLSVYTYHGNGITGDAEPLLDFDVVITTYGVAVNYNSTLCTIKWDLLILDEAQYIKNPKANRSIYIKNIPKKSGIAVSGTPFENRLTDIWSITDFVFPKYLGTLNTFQSLTPDQSLNAAEDIEPLIRPLLLRRKISDVANDLPERIDIPVYLEMDLCGAMLYEETRRRILEEHPSGGGLAIIQPLRMFCAHPFLTHGNTGDILKSSRKYQALCNIVEEVVANSEKFLIFTSFNNMNELLVHDLSKRYKIPIYSITGKVEAKTRQEIIDEFSKVKGSSGMILNPIAAGTGLNITAASYVIHYNPEWNPAKEDQASARAYRRGQTKTVRIYRLIYSNTLEEIMDDRLTMKREIADILIVGNKGDTTQSDVLKALGISPYRFGTDV